METREIKEGVVSVIVPIYNAEKYLGYTLNSIVSQTYRKLEIILVDDGSTDSSIKICKNYSQIDDRVIIISVENGGVSRARNLGLREASGEYIQFVDAEDVIDLGMIERMVELQNTYQTDMVVCGFDMVTLDQGGSVKKTVSFSSQFMGNECVLTKDLFFEKAAYILWRSSLLECTWNKLYRTEKIRENSFAFPESLSLGEDFWFVMDYIGASNGVAFTADKFYFYLQANEASLTRKYREDFFVNQMKLIEHFENVVRRNATMTKEEEKELAEYTVAKMIQSLVHVITAGDNITEGQKKQKVAQIINDSYIRESLLKAEYIDEQYCGLVECMKHSDVDAVIRFVEETGLKQNNECVKNDETIHEGNPLNRGIINRIVVRVLVIANKGLKSDKIKCGIDYIYWNGLKAAFNKYRK